MIFYRSRIPIFNIFFTFVIAIEIAILPNPSYSQEENLPSIYAPSSSEHIQKEKEILQKQRALEKGEDKSAQEAPKLESTPTIHEKRPSTFEAYIQGKNPPPISTDINQFGYDLFEKPPSTFAPVDTVPVEPYYLLGPGDEISINVWGKMNAVYTSTIDMDGKIILPQMGVLYLSGLTFQEAKEAIEKEFARYYNLQEVKINISTGRLRSIRVFVVGKAEVPGSYTLSSHSTLINALFAAGGPSKNGTMRDIQVRRNGGIPVHFDMYDFLLKGDKTKDVRLMPEDVIFLPPVGPLVGIAGNVNTPAIYELTGEISLKGLIDMAGGLNDIALIGRIQITRVINNSRQIILESDLNEIKAADIKIQPGDLVKIFSIVQDKKVVILSGAIYMEGEYGLSQGMTLKDLIAMAGGLKKYAYTKEVELTRVTPTQDGPKTEKIMIDLKEALEGNPKHDIPLKENDYIYVKAVPEWDLYKTVTINGEVRFPGVYTIEKGERLSFLIRRAGGFTDKAFLKGAIFTRESVRDIQQTQLNEAIDRLEHQIIAQSAQSAETAYSSERMQQQAVAAEQREVLIAKMRAAKAKGRISIKLNVLEKFAGSTSDIVLEEGDTLIIPGRPDQIQVVGAVFNQTSFIYDPTEAVSTYIEKAGGLTKDADKSEIYLLKVDGTAISKKVGRGFMSNEMVLDPGDTIVIPEKVEKIAWLREIKDITQILYQIAVTAGVLIVVF